MEFEPNYLYDMIQAAQYRKDGDDVDWTVLESGSRTYLLFRGSNSDTDWRNNFDFWAKVYKNQESPMLCHRGFGRAYRSCNDVVMSALIEAQERTGCAVVMCGHSFGGAMALLAAEDFFWRTGIRADVVTFGAPRCLVGRRTLEYVRSCCGEVTQYAHRNDIVPMLPPIPCYRHVRRVDVGKRTAFGIFNVKYHQIYGDGGLYAGAEE